MAIHLCAGSFLLSLISGTDLTVAITVPFSVQGVLDPDDELILQGG